MSSGEGWSHLGHRSCERYLSRGTRPDMSKDDANNGFSFRIRDLRPPLPGADSREDGETSHRDDR